MRQNIYDDEAFFQGYAELPNRQERHAALGKADFCHTACDTVTDL